MTPGLTKGVQDRAQDVQADWNKYKQQMVEIETKDIGSYNQMFKDKNMPALNLGKKEIVISN